MRTIIFFYSYTGHTKELAKELAEQKSVAVVEIRDIKRPGKLKAYLRGSFAAIRGKEWPIQKLEVDLAAYDRLILLSPVWAGSPPPAVNAWLGQLPEGKAVSVRMVSASGKSDCKKRIESVIRAKGCVISDFEDIKARLIE